MEHEALFFQFIRGLILTIEGDEINMRMGRGLE